MSKKATEFQRKAMSWMYRGKEIFKPLNTGWIDENVACVREWVANIFFYRKGDTTIMVDAGYNYDSLAEKMGWLGIDPKSIRNEADILKFVDALISNTKGEGKEGDPFWTKSETLLYCALIAYIIFEGPAEDRNMNTLVDMISGMEVKEDDEDFMNAVDYMFAGLEKRKPDCFAVKQYKKYKLASGDICSK